MNSRIAFAAVCTVLALAGCSRNKVKDKEAPAKLVELRETLPVQRLWSASVGGDKPVLRLGLGLGLEGERVFAAGHDGDVAAFDLKSGRSLWRTRTKAALSGGTGAGSGIVAVGSADGEVIALKSADGAALWRTKVGGEVLSAPAVSEKIVVVRSVDGRLHGLSSADGKEVWREEQQIPRLTLRGAASPVISGDAVYCGFDNGKVLALSLADGAKLWEATVSPPRGRTELERLVDIDSAVHVSGENVLAVGFQGRAAMLARESGQIWWSRDVSSYRGLDVDDDGVLIATAGGQLLMLSRRNGTELWHNDSLLHRRLSPPTIVGDAVAVADSDGMLHWFDRQSGDAVARDKVGDAISTAPIAINGELLLITDKGRIQALKPGVRAVAAAAPAPVSGQP
jgi:outer membrane protein assembly factor BamB